MDSIFRALVAITAVLTVASWSMPYIDHMWLSNEQLYLLDQSGLGAKIPASAVAYWGELIVWLGLTIGLFFYVKAARTGFVVFYIISITLSLFYGVRVTSPYESAILSILGLADGAILAMAYLTSISAKFENRLPDVKN